MVPETWGEKKISVLVQGTGEKPVCPLSVGKQISTSYANVCLHFTGSRAWPGTVSSASWCCSMKQIKITYISSICQQAVRAEERDDSANRTWAHARRRQLLGGGGAGSPRPPRIYFCFPVRHVSVSLKLGHPVMDVSSAFWCHFLPVVPDISHIPNQFKNTYRSHVVPVIRNVAVWNPRIGRMISPLGPWAGPRSPNCSQDWLTPLMYCCLG